MFGVCDIKSELDGAINTTLALTNKRRLPVMADATLPQIITRKQAIEKGLKRYFTGLSCPKSHISERRTHNGECVNCAQKQRKIYYENNSIKIAVKGKKWRTENSNEVRAYQKKYYKNNPEKFSSNWESWREKNPEKIPEYQKKYYLNNIERISDYKKQYRINNSEKCLSQTRNRRARKRLAGGFHNESDVLFLLIKQKQKCALCKKSIAQGHHVDHIVPLAKGGTNWPRNLQILCPNCNRKKSAKDPLIFAREIGLLL